LRPRDTLDGILRRRTLRVAVQWMPPPDSGEPPEFYKDPETGEPNGIAITLSRLMARDLGVDAEFVDTPWEEQIPALHAGRVDLLPKHTNIPERALLVDFADRLLRFDVVAVVHERTGITALDELNRDDIVLATWPGSSCRRAMGRHVPAASVVETTAPRDAVRSGRAHGMIHDNVTRRSVELYPEQRLLRGADGRVMVLAHEYGHPAVYPGDQRFLNWINNWIAYGRAQGELEYWCETWWRQWFAE
jgi:polar amino acid transport system substrate-binding protein